MTGIALKDAGRAFLGDHKAKRNLLIGTDKKMERKMHLKFHDFKTLL
jgi:hypothetical protein